MVTIYSENHAHHHGKAELAEGEMKAAVETPARAHAVVQRIREIRLGEVLPPREHDRSCLERVHAPAYLHFLETAWDLWVQEHGQRDAFPIHWVVRGMRQVEPTRIDGRIGFYAGDAGTPITAGTWIAARAAANVALTGADEIAGGRRSVFALCRPPGHHASADTFSGYCFLNNAAIAAQALLDRGARRVAIVDIDYHHGNGTQRIFYDRADVLFVSIHADPAEAYPYYLGYADERGEGAGDGHNLNLPLPARATFERYREALTAAAGAVRAFAPDALILSLGVDTYEGDPIAGFRLATRDYPRIGAMLAELHLPTLFVMEGGYAVDAIGENVAGVLTGFEGAAPG